MMFFLAPSATIFSIYVSGDSTMNDPRHWLYRPDNWPKLWKWGGALLALSVVAEFFVELHPGFWICRMVFF